MRGRGLLPARYLSLLRGGGSHLADQLRPGVVYATTAVYRPEGDPYNVVLVDLEEGFRMMSRVEGVPAQRVEVGARVKLGVDRENDDPVPVFLLRDEDR